MVKFSFVTIFLMGLTRTALSQGSTTPSDVYVDNVCICVTAGFCGLAGGDGGNSDGAGVLDARIMSSGSGPSPITGANNETMVPATSGLKPVITTQTTCAAGLERCCPSYFTCGVSYPPVETAPQPLEGQGQSDYGAFPWQAALLAMDNRYLGAGVLIDHMHVLTAAHKIKNTTLPFKVRFGEWDAGSPDTEPFNDVEISTSQIFIHPKFNPTNLHNDIAIIRLASPAPIGENPTITNICLPSMPIKAGLRCWTSGWGKNDFSGNGAYQAIMKAVDVPLDDIGSCQTKMRATRLGKSFNLDPSFLCAGGEAAKDACVGDGGSPLSCSIGGKWFLAGLVAWGIGVYVNVFYHLAWIQQTTSSILLQNSNIKTTAGSANATTKAAATTTKAAAATTMAAAATTMAAAATTTAAAATTKAAAATTMAAGITTTTVKPNLSAAPASATTLSSGGNGTLGVSATPSVTTAKLATSNQPAASSAQPSTTTVKPAASSVKAAASATTAKAVKNAGGTTKKPVAG